MSWRQFPLNSRRNHFPHPPNRQVRAFQIFEDVTSSCCKKRCLRCTLTAVWRWPMREYLISEGHPVCSTTNALSSSSDFSKSIRAQFAKCPAENSAAERKSRIIGSQLTRLYIRDHESSWTLEGSMNDIGKNSKLGKLQRTSFGSVSNSNASERAIAKAQDA